LLHGLISNVLGVSDQSVLSGDQKLEGGRLPSPFEIDVELVEQRESLYVLRDLSPVGIRRHTLEPKAAVGRNILEVFAGQT
jgi:hypothetical protein